MLVTILRLPEVLQECEVSELIILGQKLHACSFPPSVIFCSEMIVSECTFASLVKLFRLNERRALLTVAIWHPDCKVGNENTPSHIKTEAECESDPQEKENTEACEWNSGHVREALGGAAENTQL